MNVVECNVTEISDVDKLYLQYHLLCHTRRESHFIVGA